jgi:CheY-like chemotaxis protein
MNVAFLADPLKGRPQRGRVLIVDDDPTTLELLGRTVQGAGFPVVLAAGGRSGLHHLLHDPTLCVVLLDLEMPEFSGWDFRRVQSGCAGGEHADRHHHRHVA